MKNNRNILALTLFSLSFLFVTCFMVSADTAEMPPPALEWLKLVHPEGDLSDLHQNVIILNAPDGGYYLVSDNTNPSGISVLKTDATGTVEGQYTREAPYERYFQLESATVANDGDIVVLVRENDAELNGFRFVLKFKFQEDELSGKMVADDESIQTVINYTAPSPYTHRGCETISSTSDGGFIIGGFVYRYFTPEECETYERAKFYGRREVFSSPYLMRLNSNFDVLWEKVYFDDYAYPITTLVSWVDEAIQTSDGGFIVSASTYLHFDNNGENQEGDCIFKVDSKGDLQWTGFTEKAMYGSHAGYTNVLETKDGDFLLSSYAEEQFSLVKFNAAGQKLWEKYYSVGSGHTRAAASLLEDDDGGYIVVGPYENDNESYTTYLVKVDESGNKLWERKGLTSELSGVSNLGKSIVTADDGGIVAAGITGSPPVTAPPTATPAGGIISDDTVVDFSSETSGAVIHYTIDGTKPDTSSPSGNSINISGDAGTTVTVKAMAVKDGMSASDVATFTYTIASPLVSNQAAAPEATLAGGVVADGTRVTLSSSTTDALINYTLDGSDPLDRSITGYEAIITGKPGEIVTLKAYASKEGMIASDIATFTYTIETDSEEDDYAIYLMKLTGGLDVDVTTLYNSENQTLDIEAAAICPVYPDDGTVTGENALSAVYQVVDADGNPTGISGNLQWNSQDEQWEALNIDISEVLSEVAAVEVSFEDDHHHTGSGQSGIYGQADLGVSSYYVMPDGHILVYATLTGLDGQLDTSGKADLSVRIAGSEEKYRLSDGAFFGDLAAQDGQYSRTLEIPGQVPAIIELYLGDKLVDSEIVNVTNKPELAVITDFNQLYEEFRDTGMVDGEDENGNGTADFYDLLECLASYARDYNGVVYNLRQEISVEHGYISYETLRYDRAADRFLAGDLIDSFINAISGQKSIKNIAIIGDDQVVPFFRRSDPTRNVDGDGTCWEEEYYDDMHGGGENPTIVDSDSGVIMTDVPYGNYDNVDPDNIRRPKLDAAVGRVFADRPAQLIDIINAYRTPISLHNAAVFQLDKDTVDWPVQVQVTLTPILAQKYLSVGNIADSPNFGMYKVYFYTPITSPNGWSPTDVTTALQNVYLNMLWSHCDHMHAGTYLKNALTSQELNCMVESPGHVMISTGCHSGYSIAHDSPEGNFDYYYNSLVRSMLAKQISYIAPTSYGVGLDCYVAYHDLLLQKFLENLLDPNISTVGEAHKKAYRQYWQRIQPIFQDYFNTYAAYGTAYYGLPTQPIDHGFRRLNTFLTAQLGSGLENIIIDPEFTVSDLEDGTKRFTVNEGSYNLEAFAPVMPLIVREIELPLDTFVSRVNLSNCTTSEYPGEVKLTTATPVNKSKGPVAGTYELPDTYPETIYWWETYEEDEHLKLVLSVIPMQYSKDSKKVTLYNHLEFEIVTGSGENELWAWGANWFGQLGDETTENRLNPVRISNANGWKAVAAANDRTLALKEDGTLWMWGYDDGNGRNQTTPVQISGDNDWAAISAGFGHNLALKTNGTLWAWGSNIYGQLGDGTYENKPIPMQIGSDSDWTALAAGDSHSIAVKADGSLWAWGLNDNGQLGDGTYDGKMVPTRTGSDNDWTAVAAGNGYSLALKADGSLWGWGNNWSGQLGDGTEEGKKTPTQIGSSTDWVKVFAHNTQSMAIKSDGTLWVWGDDGNSDKLTTPTQVGNEGNWIAAAIGNGYTIALKSDGSLWAWGRNHNGQLGDGSTEDKTAPTRIGSDNFWKAVAAGSAHTVALTGQPDSEPEEPIDECFIATAAFGSKLAPAVKLLRQFRDIYLLTNAPGKAFVKMYYTHSPAIAKVIAGNAVLKMIVKILLLPVIALAWLIMNSEATLIIVAILAALVIIRRQTRKAA
ncbi:MAG: CFI-box-CTERM domain-containing protein [Syntrophomonadaceae bacterium]|jgi:alpha-tubulin suppressor-like RCC1 family protein